MQQIRHWVKLEESYLSRFKAYKDYDNDHILIRTRKEADIVGEKLVGSEIHKRSDGYVIWTSHKKKAIKVCQQYGFKYKKYTGAECELFVPKDTPEQRIVEVLLAFGAKPKRIVSPEQRKVLSERMSRLQSLRQNHDKTGGSCVEGPKTV